MRSSSKLISVWAAATLLLLQTACSDSQISAPARTTTHAVPQFDVVTWRVDNGSLVYLSASESGKGSSLSREGTVAQRQPSAAAIRRQREIEDGLVGAAIVQQFGLRQLRSPRDISGFSLSRPVRPRLVGGKTISFGRVSGKTIAVQMLDRSGPRGRRATMVLLVDGRAIEIRNLEFGEGVLRNSLARSTSFVLDSLGRVKLVIEATAQKPDSTAVALGNRVKAHFDQGVLTLARWILPPEARAASVSRNDICFDETEEEAVLEGGSCWIPAGKVAVAAGVYALAISAYLAGVEACIAAPPACLGLNQLLGYMTAAAGALALESAELTNCLAKLCKKKADTIPAIGGGGGGPSGQFDCYEIIWEISYDGGTTWQFLDSEIICN